MYDKSECVLAIIVIAVVVLMVVAVFNIPTLSEGVVVDKTFVPAHTKTRVQIVHTGKVAVPSRRTIHHPDTWRIHVSGISDKGSEMAAWWTVPEALYNSIEIGDRVRRDLQTDVVTICDEGYDE